MDEGGIASKFPVMSLGVGGRQGPDQLEAKPRGPSPGWQETAEHVGDRMPMVLGRGWIEAAVSTLHCSSLDSVFLSPIYTLSVQQAALQPAKLNSRSLSLHLDHTCLPPAHFSPPVPRPTSHLQSLQGSISGSSPPPTPISQFTPSLEPVALGKLPFLKPQFVTCENRETKAGFLQGKITVK